MILSITPSSILCHRSRLWSVPITKHSGKEGVLRHHIGILVQMKLWTKSSPLSLSLNRYSFAIVGINITAFAVQTLRTRQLQHYLFLNGTDRSVYHELYCKYSVFFCSCRAALWTLLPRGTVSDLGFLLFQKRPKCPGPTINYFFSFYSLR